MVVVAIWRDPVRFSIMSHLLEFVNASPVSFSVLVPEGPLPIAVACPFRFRDMVWSWDGWSPCTSMGVRARIAIVTNNVPKSRCCVRVAFISSAAVEGLPVYQCSFSETVMFLPKSTG